VRWRSAVLLSTALAVSLAVVGPAHATFPGANGKLAFQTDKDGNWEIYTVNPDGGGLTNLTMSPADDEDPSWSPDGSKIVYDSGPGPFAEIWVMNADGSGKVQLTHDGTFDVFPSFSPDGKKIVYTSTITGDAEIWVMNANGTDPVHLTHSPGEDDTPEFSPDGKRIAFSSQRDGNFEIYVMNADGSDQTNLTRNPASDQVPHWAPSGNAIVFTTNRDGNVEVYVMLPDGSGPINVTDSSSRDGLGMFSPDGLSFAYASDDTALGRAHASTSEGTADDKPQCGYIRFWDPHNQEQGKKYFHSPEEYADYIRELDHMGFEVIDVKDKCAADRELDIERLVSGAAGATFSMLTWQPLPAADMSVGISGPTKAKKGKTINYKLTAANARTGLPEDHVKVTLMLPSGVALSGLDPACDRAGRAVTCDLGTLGPWEQRDVRLTLRSRSARTLSLSATATGSLPELDPSNNTATKTTKVS